MISTHAWKMRPSLTFIRRMKMYHSGFTFFPYIVPWPVFVLDPWALPVLLPSSVVQAVVHHTAWVAQRPVPVWAQVNTTNGKKANAASVGIRKERCRVTCHLFVSGFCEIFKLLSVLTSIQQADRREQSLLLLSGHLSLPLQQHLTDPMCGCCFSVVCILNCCPSLNPWWFVSVGNQQHATVESSALDCGREVIVLCPKNDFQSP